MKNMEARPCRIILLFIAALGLFLHACATPHAGPLFSVSDEKNALPVLDRKTLEEARSVAVPAFYGDAGAWRETAAGILGSNQRLAVASANTVDAASRGLQGLPPEERTSHMAGIGKAVNADAVLSGFILERPGRREIILQLISSSDSHVLWLQSVDITPGDVGLSLIDQQTILERMIRPILPVLATRDKVAEPVRAPGPRADEQLKTEPQPCKEQPARTELQKKPAPKQKKKTDKGARPSKAPSDLSPM